MKKSFFYLAAGALALTACTSEEVLDESSVHSNAIGFENVVSKQSRAGEYDGQDITADNLNHFSVFGYYTNPNTPTQAVLVLNNELVSRAKEGENVWTYENTRYWVPGATYYFYAYSCGDIKLNSNYGSFAMDLTQNSKELRVLTITDYICDNTHQHDLLFASKEGVTPPSELNDKGVLNVTGNPTVAFKFEHILSRVDANFTSAFAPEYTVEITDVKISNIRNRGDYDPNPTKGWVNQERYIANEGDSDPFVTLLGKDEANSDKFKVITARKGGKIIPVGGTEDDAIKIEEQVGVSDFAFVLPYKYFDNNLQTTISFTATVKKDGELILSRNLSGSWKPTWKAGYKYTYNIEISGNTTDLTAIVFQTENDAVGGWQTDEENTPTIPIHAN